MFEVFALMFGCMFLATIYQASAKPIPIDRLDSGNKRLRDESVPTRLLFVVIVAILVCFAGLRSRMNDTAAYILSFNRMGEGLSELKNINWSIGANPFFRIYQIMIHSFISDSSSVFIFITSLIVETSYMFFYRKYSPDFSLGLFIFFGLGVFHFTTAAIKQTLSMAIAIWALPLWLHKKRILSVLLVLVAMMFHPYIIILFAGYFLFDNIWDKKTLLILLGTLIVLITYSSLVDSMIDITVSIGDVFTEEDLTSKEGVSLFRLLVYAVPVALSFAYREKIREKESKMLNLFVNFGIVAFCLMTVARIGSPVMITRVESYIDIFVPLAFAGIIKYGVSERKNVKVLTVLAVCLFSVFYFNIYKKYGTGLWDCFFTHIDIIDLIKNW